MREKLVVGNWKMNGGLAANAKLLDTLAGRWSAPQRRTLVVCVPFPYLGQAQSALTGTSIRWGAQNSSAHPPGAYTGEVAASMLMEFGCHYAIVGHSERRQLLRESDVEVGAKAAAVLAAGITPIACVGETLAEREAGATATVVLRQLDAVLSAVSGAEARLIVAYEPVWAIGTGKTARPHEAQSVHATLRARLMAIGAGSIPLLYGGSVKGENARALFAQDDIDGGLIGGASLNADEFLAIAGA